MIKIDLSLLVFIMLFFNVVVVLVIWAFDGYKRSRPGPRTGEEHVRHCEICANIYIDSRADKISKCPQCGSYNTKK